MPGATADIDTHTHTHTSQSIWHYLLKLNTHLCYKLMCYTLAQQFQSWIYKL